MLERLLKIEQLIEKQEYAEVKKQADCLRKEDTEQRVAHLIDMVEQNSYADALCIAQKMIRYLSLPKPVEDHDIVGLKTIERLCEVELSVLYYKKADLHRLINNFRLQHNRELGEIIAEILKIRKELLHDELKKNPDEEETQNQYAEAKKDFEQFHQAFEQSKGKKIVELATEDKKRLRKTFWAASKLCHPDVVAPESKTHAQEVFNELTKAYFSADQKRLNQILERLESGKIHLIKATEDRSEKKRLQNRISKLENDIEKLKFEIQQIKESDSYITILQIDDQDKYFAQIKERLSKELELLKKNQEQNQG